MAGLALAVGAAMATTWMLTVSGMLGPDVNLLSRPLLEERVRPGWYSVIAAVAAGVAGTIAVSRERVDTLIGIVASVALVPAGAAAGIALMSGAPVRAVGGGVLLAVNVLLIVGTALVVIALMGPRVAR